MKLLPELPPELSLAPFTVREAFDRGVPPARLRRVDLDAPFRGARWSSHPETLLDRCEAYAPLLRPGHVFSHGSAGVIWSMWLPRRVTEGTCVDVLAAHPARPPRMRGVRGHRTTTAVDVSIVREFSVTSAAETWRMLAPLLTVGELVQAADSLLRRDGAVVEPEDLARAVVSHAGRRGAAKLALAVGLARPGCDSPRETSLRLLLRAARLPEPSVNSVVSAPGAPITRYGDLVWEKWRVIAEYDGEQHRTDPKRYTADVERLEQLAAEGWIVIRVLKSHLQDPAAVVRRVEAALRSRGWRDRRSRGHF